MYLARNVLSIVIMYARTLGSDNRTWMATINGLKPQTEHRISILARNVAGVRTYVLNAGSDKIAMQHPN